MDGCGTDRRPTDKKKTEAMSRRVLACTAVLALTVALAPAVFAAQPIYRSGDCSSEALPGARVLPNGIQGRPDNCTTSADDKAITLPIKVSEPKFMTGNTLVLIYPKDVPEAEWPYGQLSKFYKEFIRVLPRHVPILWVVKTPAAKMELEDVRADRHWDYLVCPQVQDIWLGDWFPFGGKDSKHESVGIQFHYAESEEDEECGSTLFEKIGRPLKKVPLFLDGGSFESNGTDFLIISSEVFESNPEISKNQITKILKKYIDVRDVFYLESPSALGHTDSIFRIVKKNAFLYSVYKNEQGEEVANENLSKLIEVIKQKYPDVSFHAVPNEKSGRINEWGINDYTGNILDFLVVGDTIIFPLFSQRSRKAYAALKSALPDNINIIPFSSDVLPYLYWRGGGLYCISGQLQ